MTDNCKLCNTEVNFPISFVNDKDEHGNIASFFLFVNQCGCALIRFQFKIKIGSIDDSIVLPTSEELKPLYDAWNKINNNEYDLTEDDKFNRHITEKFKYIDECHNKTIESICRESDAVPTESQPHNPSELARKE